MINESNRGKVASSGKWSMRSGWFFVAMTLIVFIMWLLGIIV